MKGIVIACHGDLADGFVSASKMILGEIENFKAVSVDVAQDPEAVQETIQEAIKDVDQGDGIFILTDLFGGTPANVSLTFLEPNKVEVITGINLPLVLKLLKDRDKYSMEALKERLIQSAVKNILNPSDVLNIGKSE
jgi:PTS system mannose-specific IIA component